MKIVGTDDFTNAEYRIATSAARKVARVNRHLLDAEDILGEMHLWMVRHADKIEQWREEGKTRYLERALYRAGQRYVLKERMHLTGAKAGDIQWYSRGILHELLPYCWEVDAMAEAPATNEHTGPKGKARLSETGNRLAMLCDVRSALVSLSPNDRELLEAVYRDNIEYAHLGVELSLTEDGVRKRVDRVLDRMVDRLGGSPPWWGERRRAVSSAKAQHDVGL